MIILGTTGNDTIVASAASDTLVGLSGDDRYIFLSSTATIIEAENEGTDTVVSAFNNTTLADNLENLILPHGGHGTGNALDNVITGGDAQAITHDVNILEGLGGNDTLISGTADDTLIGGLGNDTYIVDSANDVVTELTSGGIDTVQSSVTRTLSANVENLTLNGTDTINGIGNELANVIVGNSADNSLNGGGGADTLIGGSGDDVFDSGVGFDTLIGGLGDDTYIISPDVPTIIELENEGTDTVLSHLSYLLGDNLENLELIGGGWGAGNSLSNTLTGSNFGVNTLEGRGGDDTLISGTADDTLIGGLGDDTYVVDSANDVVTELTSGGTDTVQSSVTRTLGANVENLTLTGTNDIDGTGNALSNTITGNSGANRLFGGGGAADTLIGGSGDDIYYFDNPTNYTFIEAENEGTDTIITFFGGYTLGENFENLSIITGHGIGNSLSNVITAISHQSSTLEGMGGDDTLIGGTGADTMIGGTGDDIYTVDNIGDVVTELASSGTDTIQSSVAHILSDNVENLTLMGTDDIDGTGNSLANTITGNSGANRLDGRGGADTLIGGLGDDTYLIGDVNNPYPVAPSIVEGENEGIDTVINFFDDYTLTDHLEHLTLVHGGRGTGNALSNVITGGIRAFFIQGSTLEGLGGNDTLISRDVDDTLIGGEGDDTYIVDSASDVVIEVASGGVDSVQSSVTYTLSANVENLTLTEANAINGTGNVLSNVIAGNAAANTLSGLAGNDTLMGGGGDDIFIVGGGNNSIEGGAGANDRAQFNFAFSDAVITESSNVISIAANGETNTFTDVESFQFLDGIRTIAQLLDPAITLEGTADVDVLVGGIGNDLISGLGSNDRLIGNEGNDTLNGGDGADTLNGGEGDDFIFGGTSENDLRDLIFAGAGNDSILGGYGNDEIFGQGGNDTIAGGFGSDTLQGQDGDDVITGSALSDLVFGNAGNDFLNGGFGHDRVNGGSGADRFFHLGILDHGSDFIQDFNHAEGDILVTGIAGAVHADFQVNFNHAVAPDGERAGEDTIREAFVIYRPTGQIQWALIDGEAQSDILLLITG